MSAQRGKDKILAFRLLEEAETVTGIKLALQVEHTLRYERSTTSTPTKDGPIVSSGGLATTIDINAVSTKDELNKKLKQSVVEDKKLEIWEIDLSSKDAEGKYDALYMRGNLNSWETPAPVEDMVNITTTASIDGVPQEGKVTLTAEQEAEISYAFRDLEKVTATP